MRTFAIVMLAILGASLLAGCAPMPPLFVSPGGGQAGAGGTLVGPVWTLAQLNGKPLVPETSITAQFSADGSVSGSAGCNRYNAPYKVDGDKIQIGQGATTMMACPEPVMTQETAYLAALAAAQTYAVSEQHLTLKDASGAALAVYSVEKQGLAGTSWEVISYNNGKQAVVSVILDTKITADFGQDGQVSGNASCNNYSGPYKTEGSSISIGQLAVTMMFCGEPEGVMDQESQYLAALQSAATYRIEGSKLEMRTAEGALAVTMQRASGQ